MKDILSRRDDCAVPLYCSLLKKITKIWLSLMLAMAVFYGSAVPAFAAEFTDVAASAWYTEAIGYVSENDLMSGTGGGRFSPGIPMSRAMLATVLYRMDGSPDPSRSSGFSDVPHGAYYEDAVSWAVEKGIVSGIGGGRFGSESCITRQDLTVMLYRYGSYKEYDLSESNSLAAFSDYGRVAGYARQAMGWAVGAGIIQGDSGRLMPTGDATRAQVAVMLMRFAQNTGGTQPSPPIEPTPVPDPTPAPTPPPAPAPQPTPSPESNLFQITVNGQTFHGEFYDNETAKAFAAMLPITLSMQELNGNEKYHYFDTPWPTNSSRPAGIRSGDLMLYGNNCLVLFYEDFSTSFSYTSIGRLDDPDGLDRALGNSSVQINFFNGIGDT